METLTLARFICELTLQEYDFVRERASHLAASCLLLALKMKKLHGWVSLALASRPQWEVGVGGEMPFWSQEFGSPVLPVPFLGGTERPFTGSLLASRAPHWSTTVDTKPGSFPRW